MIIAAALALMIAASPQEPPKVVEPAPTPFTRTYKLKEQVLYRLELNSGEMGTVKSVVEFKVQKLLPKGATQILLKATDYTSSGDTQTPVPPSDQNCIFLANNLPESVKIMQTNWVYMFVTAAGATPDKVVKVGDEFPLTIKFPDGDLVLKGNGKLTGVDAVKNTATIEWKYSYLIGGTDYGSMKLISVYDQTNYSLIKSTSDAAEVAGIAMKISISKVIPMVKMVK